MTTDKPIMLSHNDIEVLKLCAVGLTAKEIAKREGKTWQTVSSRIWRAQSKLGARNRTHAVALAMAAGLIEGPEPVPAMVGVRRSLAEFAEDFAILSLRGLTRPQIAAAMGIKRDSVDRNVWKARRAGLLPHPFRRAGVTV